MSSGTTTKVACGGIRPRALFSTDALADAAPQDKSAAAGSLERSGSDLSAQVSTLQNTYVGGISAEHAEVQPEMVRRVLMLMNGRRKDLTKAQKQAALEKHKLFVDDTGSPEVQAAVLSTRIRAMAAHFQANRKDYACQRHLTRLLNQRRRTLQYLHRLSLSRYEASMANLGLKESVAPRPLPGFLTQYDVFKVPPSRETKTQRKKRMRFAAKLAKNEELREKKRMAARSRRGAAATKTAIATAAA